MECRYKMFNLYYFKTHLTLRDFFSAQKRIRPFILHTPLEYSEILSRNCKADIYLKMESQQKTGSFKPRGAFNQLMALMPVTITFPIIQKVVDRFITITEESVIKAMRFMMDNHQQIVEPSRAAAIAALLNMGDELEGYTVGVTVTGRNVGSERYLQLLQIK